jgi:hypothetical protein
MHWNADADDDAVGVSSPTRRRRDRSTTGSTRRRYGDWFRRLPTWTVPVRCRSLVTERPCWSPPSSARDCFGPVVDVAVIDAAGSTKLVMPKIDSTGLPTSVSRSGRSTSSRKARFTCCK